MKCLNEWGRFTLAVYYGIMQKYRIFHLLFLRIEKHE